MNQRLLNGWLDTFYGYGHWSAPTWFVGMEEGGGRFEERLHAWQKLARPGQNPPHLAPDLRDFCMAIELRDWHDGPHPKIQPTWGKLIRFLLATRGTPANEDLDRIRDYQAKRWGTRDGETCLIELLPLPSQRASSWDYSKYSWIHRCLASRKEYEACLAPGRCAFIASKLAHRAHAPKLVVFYGLSYVCYWQQITEGTMQPMDLPSQNKLWLGRRGGTLFCALKHPTCRGACNGYFEEAAEFVGRRLLS
jgi:hypothetical protein